MAVMSHLFRRAARSHFLPRRFPLQLSPGPIRSSPAYLVPLATRSISSQPMPLSSARTLADERLMDVLKSEMEEAPEESLPVFKGGSFALTDTEGTEEIVLRGKFQGEDIHITCTMEIAPDDQVQDEEEEIEEGDVEHEGGGFIRRLYMTVNISKGESKPIVSFDCYFSQSDSEVNVEKVSYLASGEESEATSQYEGPQFEDLDDNLQSSFQCILEARGITAKLGNSVLDYLTAKEKNEYRRWLMNVHDFFAKA